MTQTEETRKITVVTACMRADGLPDFVVTEVDATDDEIANGAHYCLAEERLQEEGYDEPFVHFDDREAPNFLIPALLHRLDTPQTVAPQLVSATAEGF